MIIIYGGSFDPPHKSHVALLQRALADNPGAKAFVVPAFKNPLKEKHEVSSDDRFVMCQRAFPFAVVDDIEQDLLRAGRTTFTFDVVSAYAGFYPDDEIRFLVGSDCVHEFPLWSRMQELKAIPRFKFMVYDRADGISSTYIRRALVLGANLKDEVPERVMEYIKERGLYYSRA